MQFINEYGLFIMMSKKKVAKKTISSSKSNESKINSIKTSYLFLSGLIILILDQLTKYFTTNMPLGSSKIIIPKLLSFTYVQNTGSSFGMFQNSNGPLIYFYIMVLGLIIYFYDTFKTKLEKIAYTLFTVGLLGNLFDRLARGFVVDFIDLGWWPVFNIADSALVIAVILLIVNEINNVRKAKK